MAILQQTNTIETEQNQRGLVLDPWAAFTEGGTPVTWLANSAVLSLLVQDPLDFASVFTISSPGTVGDRLVLADTGIVTVEVPQTHLDDFADWLYFLWTLIEGDNPPVLTTGELVAKGIWSNLKTTATA